MITAHALNSSSRVRHGFFTRQGGVSQGLYGSLNCGFGSGDNPDHVAANRANAQARLAGDKTGDSELVSVYQVHSPTVVHVNEPWAPGDAPQADAMVTARPGVALGVLTADCAPVLFADANANAGSGVIAAAHAGWQGALAGVVEATVQAMIELGAKSGRICAAIGPCIQQESYEVGPEFRERFKDADPANGNFFIPSSRQDHFMFDLPGYIGRTLDGLGIAFETTGEDTCADEQRFFSYRRATHRGEKDYGRGLSAILLAGG
ncbi:MAG: peptidoglycan editing factor PgeF [Alphaproteobacteria bacterium]|jgi:polyphenol oxidase|nr:peptidoglycan editing factor PgeF [Alphaproteobacteria bacterium]